MTDVTRVLQAIEAGDPHAAAALLPLVYEELRKLAAQKLAHEQPDHTLEATALVHEAYLRLVGNEGKATNEAGQKHWDSRGHFFAAAAEAMRRILIDSARRKKRLRHGGGRQRVDLAEGHLQDRADPDQLLAVDEALSKLAGEDPQTAELVKLRFYAGLSIEQAAETLGMSRAGAYRLWSYAKAWLRCQIGPVK
jgi:RNA polymerase sigma factor (TIGR02999 family)